MGNGRVRRRGIEDEVNDNPIEEVRLTVPITDDPSLPCLTFRTWILGILCCVTLSCASQFLNFRQNRINIPEKLLQVMVLMIGRFMERIFPEKTITIPLTKWTFSLNPGPFNIKEHCLITMLIETGYLRPSTSDTFVNLKAFYHRNVSVLALFLLTIGSQIIGYGWAGILRNLLVDSPYMWWPETMGQVALFRAFHDIEIRKKKCLTKLQFFIIAMILSFAYYIVPNYYFPSIMALSTLCWIWKDSVIAQQLGSGFYGLGLGAFAVDWTTVAGFLGSPLNYPAFTIINMLVGYILFMYILLPISYWTNLLNAKRFPIMSLDLFAFDGTPYNVTRVLNAESFDLNHDAYDHYSKVYLSISFALKYGLTFAFVASSLVHVTLFNGREIWKGTMVSAHKKLEDVHARIMRKHYKPVPLWWFYMLMVVSIGLTIVSCEGFGRQLQLPWWGVILAVALGFITTLPSCIITATSGIGFYYSIINRIIVGYMMPGKPLANEIFMIITDLTLAETTDFLFYFKMGHYIKIPPKSMFLVQIVGSLVNAVTSFATLLWIFNSTDHLCDVKMLPKGSPWTCPGANFAYSNSAIWGVVGPLRMFGKYGAYSRLNYFFLFGLCAPMIIWFLSLKFPHKKWIELINVPLIIGATEMLLLNKPVNYNCWFAVGIFFNIYIYRKYKGWWARYNYILSAGLDAGVAFMALLCAFTLQSKGIYGPNWWGLELSDHCALKSCPTAPGIVVEGCPVF